MKNFVLASVKWSRRFSAFWVFRPHDFAPSKLTIFRTRAKFAMRNERRCGKFCRATLAGWKRCLAGIAPIGARGSGERLNDVRNDSSLVKSQLQRGRESRKNRTLTAPARDGEFNSYLKATQPIPNAPLKVNRRSFRHIFCGTGNLANRMA